MCQYQMLSRQCHIELIIRLVHTLCGMREQFNNGHVNHSKPHTKLTETVLMFLKESARVSNWAGREWILVFAVCFSVN